MSLFVFNEAVDFRAVLALIDAQLPGDVDAVQDLVVLQKTWFNDLGGQAGLTLEVTAFLGTTSFLLTDETVPTAPVIQAQFTMNTVLDVAGGYGLSNAIASISGSFPDYISDDPGAVIVAFGTRDEMLGQGRMEGRGGDDKIELEATDGGLGAAARSLALGGGGDDILKAAVLDTALRGGKGADTLVLEFGKSRMNGGDGADAFIIDNGFWDLTGSSQQASQNARGSVQDFDGADDVIVLASVDSSMAFGDAPVRTSLETLYGAGTLATLADFSLDGVSYMFRETGSGNARIRRVGEDGEGRSYDEALVIRGQSLASIDRADVVLMDYAADTYELF